jgi:murein DD-endopeptidase MepM/ murein hydrolase activator NlpD
MIESQTELPAQEGESAKSWARGRQVLATIAGQVEDKIRALPGTRGAQYLRDVRSLAAGLTARSGLTHHLQLRTYLVRVLQWLRVGFGDGPVHRRFALHLVVILLAVGVVAVTRVSIPNIDLRLAAPTPAPEPVTHAVTTVPTNRGGGRFVSNNTGLFQAPVPHTIIPERDRMEIITYTVQANDNVWSIANGFGLQVETIVWANPAVEKAPDLLSVGQVLAILPVDGIYHAVQPGDTVDKLAKEFKTEADKIASFELNRLEEPYALTPGQMLVIPGGRKKIVPSNYYPMTRVGRPPAGAPKGSGRFSWPAQGYLSQAFWSGHQAVDIANRTGIPILAADAGYVVMAGRDTWGYGNQVLINHGNGFLTRYAHLNKLGVKAGDSVQKGQPIGTMGSTGRSTGPHLHFEVIQGNVRRNPLGFLP